jgi:hypothetical protein
MILWNDRCWVIGVVRDNLWRLLWDWKIIAWCNLTSMLVMHLMISRRGCKDLRLRLYLVNDWSMLLLLYITRTIIHV